MNKYRELLIKKILPIVFLALFAELFVCNYRHWESLANGRIKRVFSAEEQVSYNGFRENGDGTLTVLEPGAGIEIRKINRRLKTAYIEIRASQEPGEESVPIALRQWARDESHQLYYELPSREIWESEKRSSYMTYHLYGKCLSLYLVPGIEAGETVSVNVVLNPQIPLFFSWERFMVLLCFLSLVCVLHPASLLHQIPYLEISSRKRKALLVLFFVVHGLLFWKLTGLNPYFQEEVYDNQRQYQELAESLKAGSFALLEEPPKALQEMENPYDMEYRNQVMNEAGEWYKWDHAYYKGKYYVYFGVVPAIMFYLPYYLVTGTHLHNCALIFILALMFLAGMMGVLHESIRKWFPKTSVAVWFLLSELLVLGSGLIYMTKRPDLYTVPILCGLAFGMLGLWCFFLSGRGKEISLGFLGTGSLLIALTAGCRPQLFLFAVPAAALLREISGRESVLAPGFFKSGRGKKAVLALLLPVILTAAALMYYNFARFGSPFDFGANYNLTMNDMRNRGFQFDRIPLGILAYLFQPIRLIQKFPFMEAVYFDSQYMGVTIQEATYGGIFMTNFFAWFSLLPAVPSRRFRAGNRTVFYFSVSCLLAAGTIIVADTNMSGILQRYFGDFSIFIMLASVFSALWLISCRQLGDGVLRRMVLLGLCVCLIGQLGYQGMAFFLDTGESLREFRPELYAHVKYLTAFWL